MESVEQWMWLVAGVIITAALIVSGYALISRYIRSSEISQAESSFSFLKSSSDSVCVGGINSQEVKSFIFPSLTEEIYVRDDDYQIGNGRFMCINISGEPPLCDELRLCSVEMQTVNLKDDSSNIFFLIQKALGRKDAVKLRFIISKTDLDQLEISWHREYASS